MLNIATRLKTSYNSNLLRGRILLGIFILTCALIIARVLLSPVIIYSANSWLEKQAIDSSIESIEISLFSGDVSLIDVQGSKGGKPLFNIGRVDVHWQWTPLSEKIVEITGISLDTLNVSVEKYTNKIIVGGVHVPLEQAISIAENKQTPETEKEDSPWGVSLGKIKLANLDVCYLEHTAVFEQSSADNKYVDYCLKLEELNWNGVIGYATDEALLAADDLPLTSTGDVLLKALKLTDNKLQKRLLEIQTASLEAVVIAGLNNLHIENLNIQALSALHRDDAQHEDTINFNNLNLSDIKLDNLNALKVDAIFVDSPNLYLVKQNENQWEYQQWLPSPATEAKSDSAPFKVNINAISVTKADLCYLENQTLLNYCLALDDLNWTGAINFASELSAKGGLDLSKLNISNNAIDRSLLSLESLAVDNLEVAELNKISLDKFTIQNLSALQRSAQHDDATLAFKALIIDDVKYFNESAVINNISLSGLASTVSKNKSGDWEHDKWQSKTTTDDATNTAANETTNTAANETTNTAANETTNTAANETTNTAANETTNTAANETTNTAVKDSDSKPSKPFKISLNTLTIKTENKLSFIDNSTTPPIDLGLEQLSLELKDLHSSKPKTDSPFKLSAKSSRHATIDIHGSVRPFDEKVSFVANGDLKGFDLRAITPSTTKAIGHIVKSGQLNAKLALLAKDGVLDSNMALSLYQFHIEPTSKEAGAELDAKVGIPLNQTLVLLRDKDDSIHLDIPITGDINKPDFDPTQAILKATTKAATVALITFYTPYGLIYAGGSILFDLATALNFDPLLSEAGNSKLTADHKKQLENLTKLLTEKPQVRLTLCGATNQADFLMLYPKPKNQKPVSKEVKPANKEEKPVAIKPNKMQNEALNKLATARQVNSKNYLIEKAKIAHDRLILCEPDISVEERALSGVEINI